MDGNMRRGETEGKGKKSSGSVARKIEITGARLRLNGIFDEGCSGPFGIIELEGRRLLKEWLVHKTWAPLRHSSLDMFRLLRALNGQIPSAWLRTICTEPRRATSGPLPRSRTV